MADLKANRIQGKRAKCQYNYKATMNDELNIKVDEIIVLTQCSEDETWLEGTLNGVTGWFPSNYVQILEDENESSEVNLKSADTDSKQEHEDDIIRNKYLAELKHTEESFLDEMCKFVKIAIQPLKSNEEIFSAAFVQNLSSSLDELIRCHQSFYQQLKEVPENSNAKIGNFLINFAPQFKLVYENYAKSNPKFTNSINFKKEQLSKYFETSLSKMSSPLLPTTSTITVAIYFTKFLAAPFKQLEIYVKLLKEIQRFTQDFHVDRGDVQRSIEFYTDLTNNVEEIRKMKEHELDIMSSKINFLEEDIFKNGESLYLSHAVIISETGEIKDRILLLFPSFLIVLSPTNLPNEFDFEYKLTFHSPNTNVLAQIKKISNIESVKHFYGSPSSSNFINKYCFELIDVVIQNKLNSIHTGRFLVMCSNYNDLKSWIELVANCINKLQFSLNNKSLSSLKKNNSINNVNKSKNALDTPKSLKCTSPIMMNGNKAKSKKMFCMRPHAPLIPQFQLPNDAPIMNNQDPNATLKRFMYKKPKSSDIGKYHGADDDLKLLNVIDSLSKTKIRQTTNVHPNNTGAITSTTTTTTMTTTSTNLNQEKNQLNKSISSTKGNESLNESLTNTSTLNEKSLYKYINKLNEEKTRLEGNLLSVNNELGEFKKANKELKTILGSMQKQLENEKQTRRKLENFIKKHFKSNQQLITNTNEQASFLMNIEHESAI